MCIQLPQYTNPRQRSRLNRTIPYSSGDGSRLQLLHIAVRLALELGKVGKSQLVGEGQRHARMLQHVIERQIRDGVVGRVDVVIRVFEGRLDDESRWVAGLGRRGVIRASVAALRLDKGDGAVLKEQRVNV